MAMTITMALVDANVVAQRPTTFQVNLTNTSAAAVTLTSLFVSESTEADAIISQPQFLTPQLAVGVGNPIVGASSTVSYTFKVVFQAPGGSGPSPGEVPTSFSANLPAFPTIAGTFTGQPSDASVVLQVVAQFSDGSTGTTSINVTPVSTVLPFPPVGTGTLQLQFQPGFNAIGGLVLGLF